MSFCSDFCYIRCYFRVLVISVSVPGERFFGDFFVVVLFVVLFATPPDNASLSGINI